jgi:hemerythrin
MLKWQEQFETKEANVDAQHRKLFDMVNALEQAVNNKTAEATIDETLSFLGKYVIGHFNYEEGCMARVKCPSSAENKKAHQEFLNVYQAFVQRYKNEGYSDALSKELLKVTQEWLIKHICGCDIRLKYYMPKK